MNDLDTRAEQAFRDALSRQADAFETTPLAPIGQRPRVRRWVGIVAAASVLAVLGGTALGVVLWRDDPGQTGRDTAGEPAAGWRFESYRDVQIEVPESWAYDAAPGSDWCAAVPAGESRFPREPYVDTRGDSGAVLDILCTEEVAEDLHGDGVPTRLWATHVTLGVPSGVPDGTETAGGWTRIARTVGAAQVRVLADADHVDEAREIIASARTVEVDHNGCVTTSPAQAARHSRPPEPFDVTEIADVDSIAVCSYALGMGTDEPGLLASRLLTGAAADDVLTAIQQAPVGSGPNRPETCQHDVTGPSLVLRLDKTREMYVYNASCFDNGFDDGTNVRELTVASCIPLYGERLTYAGFDGTPGSRCHPGLADAGPK